MDKLNDIIKRWELIEDQLNGLEYHLLNEQPTDATDIDYAGQFARVRSELARIRVQYQQAKTMPESDNKNKYEFGAPRFAYDD